MCHTWAENKKELAKSGVRYEIKAFQFEGKLDLTCLSPKATPSFPLNLMSV
jgi:hypothetical protein